MTVLASTENRAPRPIHQIIEPAGGWIHIQWREIWQHRELLYFLAWRDIRSRYKQTVLGAAWAVLQPLATMAVFTFFFGRLAGLESKTGGIPYPVFVFSGLLPWMFFSSSVSKSSNSLLGNANLLTKVYFPRLILPLSAVGVNLLDMLVSLVVLVVLMAAHGMPLSWQVLVLPLLVAGLVLAAAGLGALLGALTVTYRDLQVVVPFGMQLWMFVTPVIYPPSLMPADRQWLLALNPMAGLVEGFRAAFLGHPLHWGQTAFSILAAALLFWCGGMVFSRMEQRFADVI